MCDCVDRWASSLQLTHVTRWGGMISTPDSVLQTVIKRALVDSGCPVRIVTDLMENSHERHWPAGLSTLEARQLNRHAYENYVCKRIPGMTCLFRMTCSFPVRHVHLIEVFPVRRSSQVVWPVRGVSPNRGGGVSKVVVHSDVKVTIVDQSGSIGLQLSITVCVLIVDNCV